MNAQILDFEQGVFAGHGLASAAARNASRSIVGSRRRLCSLHYRRLERLQHAVQANVRDPSATSREE